MISTVHQVTFFVPDINAAARWYADLLGSNVEYENPLFAFVRTGGANLGFHPADEKSPGGHGGSVAYFRVADLDAVLARLEAAGARRYRGPGPTDLGERVCMVLDPFGSAIGLIQPR